MRGIWYEFMSPNNIHMVCLGDYNWEMVDEYGWNKSSPNYDASSNQELVMMIGSPMGGHNTLTYNLSNNILIIDDVKMKYEIHNLNKIVNDIVDASGWKVIPLFSKTPDGFDKHLRLLKLKKLLGK